jgi:glycosyltransferase involved in cell wall biosynthesis
VTNLSRVAIKVVTMVDQLGRGGGERVAASVACRLDPARFESILCVTRRCPAEVVEQVRGESAVRIVQLGRAGRRSVRPWVELTRLLRNERVQVLHTHKYGSNAWGSLVARAARTPVFVSHEHSWSYEGDALRMFVDRHLIATRAQAMIAVSALDRSRMIERERIPEHRIVLRPNGIPRPDGVERGTLRRELGLAADVPIVGFVGRLSPEKRVDVLVDAIATAATEHELRCVIVGSGPEEGRLRAQVAELGCGDRVTFLGDRLDAVSLAADFDVAVLSSDREGCPLAILEYMALARPIVATRVGGVPDLVIDEVHGLLVEPGDVRGVAAAISRLLADADLSETLGRAASRRQRSEFSLDTVVASLEELYERLVAEPSRVGASATREPAGVSLP